MKTVYPKSLPIFLLTLMLCCFSQAFAARTGVTGGIVPTGATSDNARVNSAPFKNTIGSADVPSLTIGNVSQNEGDSGTTNFSFTVNLSAPSSDAVTVDFSTANGTATSPSDFQSASGTIFFNPGETVKSLVVTVNGDTVAETDETFTVNLSNATNATIAGGQGIGTILNDDSGTAPACTVSVSPTNSSVGAGGSSANTVAVSTQAGCAFSATTNDSFITINSGANGAGSGTVSFSVAANPGGARTGTIFIAGQAVTVNQAGSGSFGLRVSITDAPDPVVLGGGQNVTYTILVNNDGPSTATGVVLTNNLPANFNFISAATTNGSCGNSGGVVTCSLGDVINSATVTITARPSAVGTFTDTVSVTGNEPESNTGDNSASTTTTVSSQTTVTADLRLIVFGSTSITVGQNVEYAIFINNDGPAPASGVVLTSTLPSNVTFVSATTTNGNCRFVAGLITCEIGDIPINGVTVRIAAKSTVPGTVTSAISITSNETDPDTSNNSTVVTTTVNPLPGTVNADLGVIALTPAPVTFNGSSNIDNEIFVSNAGPSPATGVVLTDTLSANVTFVSATPSQGVCNFAAGVVTCNLGTVVGNAAVSILTRPTAAGTITNTVSVQGNEADFNLSNNNSTTTTTVSPGLRRKKTLLSSGTSGN